MSRQIAGDSDTAVAVVAYARGHGLGMGYQVTWRDIRGTHWLSFDDEDKAMALYHLVYLSLDVA